MQCSIIASAAFFKTQAFKHIALPGITLSRAAAVSPPINIEVSNKTVIISSNKGDPVWITPGFAFAHWQTENPSSSERPKMNKFLEQAIQRLLLNQTQITVYLQKYL